MTDYLQAREFFNEVAQGFLKSKTKKKTYNNLVRYDGVVLREFGEYQVVFEQYIEGEPFKFNLFIFYEPTEISRWNERKKLDEMNF